MGSTPNWSRCSSDQGDDYLCGRSSSAWANRCGPPPCAGSRSLVGGLAELLLQLTVARRCRSCTGATAPGFRRHHQGDVTVLRTDMRTDSHAASRAES